MQPDATDIRLRAATVEAHSVWPADPVHLPHIRALTRSWLAPLALDSVTEQDLVLAVNEAATNAIEHAYDAAGPDDQVKVSFWTEPDHVNVEVADHGRWREADTDHGYRGHGIPIMEHVVESVSIDRDGNGTRVLLRHPTR